MITSLAIGFGAGTEASSAEQNCLEAAVCCTCLGASFGVHGLQVKQPSIRCAGNAS